MRIKAIVFDLDGTLVSPELSVDTYTYFGGKAYRKALERLKNGKITFHQFLIEGVRSLKGVKAKEIENFVSKNLEKYLKKGAEECIRELHSEMEVGIVTRNFWTYTKPIARRLGIGYVECSYFDIIDGKLTGIVEYEIDKPEGIKRIARKMNVGLKEIAYVDDELSFDFVGISFLLSPSSKVKNSIKNLYELPLLIKKLP